MNHILLLFAHPALEKSRVNRRLARAVKKLRGVTFNDLYEQYPEFDVDVAREQELLVTHDIIVMQHPFYWYSTPPIVKQWEDLVLEHGWAYGTNGDKLRGKKMLTAITTGGGEDAYRRDGHNGHTVNELLAPISQTAKLCGMDYLPPFVAYGTHGMKKDTIREHQEDYRRVIEALRDGNLDFDAAREHSHLNADLDAIIRKGSD